MSEGHCKCGRRYELDYELQYWCPVCQPGLPAGWLGRLADVRKTPEPRFYLEHGMIHDRETGKHVCTDDVLQPNGGAECLALVQSFADRIVELEREMAHLAKTALEGLRPFARYAEYIEPSTPGSLIRLEIRDAKINVDDLRRASTILSRLETKATNK